MAGIDAISADLQAMAAGIEQAHTAAAGADARAQEIAARAARSGFAGIAAGMVQVRRAIGEIRTRLTGIGAAVNEAVKPVTAAPQEMSPEQTITVLSPATEKLTAARDGIAATIGKVDQTRRLAATVLHGGQPGPMLTTLDAIKQILDQLTARCDAAQQHLRAAVAEARQIGGQGN